VPTTLRFGVKERMKQMKTLTTIALTLAMITSAAADPADNKSFYDRNGHFSGSSTTHENSTAFTDNNGRFSGTAIQNNDGTTSFYDRDRHFTGSVVNTSPQMPGRTR
jgi:hypothetical protein